MSEKNMNGGEYCRKCPYSNKLYNGTYVCIRTQKTVVNRRGGGTVSSMKCK